MLPRKKEHATKRSIAFLLAEDAPFDTGIFSMPGESPAERDERSTL